VGCAANLNEVRDPAMSGLRNPNYGALIECALRSESEMRPAHPCGQFRRPLALPRGRGALYDWFQKCRDLFGHLFR
jgi:hypothetical protein